MSSTATPDLVADAPQMSRRPRLVMLRNAKAGTGIVILALFALLGLIGPWIAPYDPNALGPDTMQGPSAAHWLGTTNTGQDILSQLLVGTRGVMVVGLTAGVVATALAVVMGITAGFVGGVGDDVLSALANVFLVIPQIPLVILVAGQMKSASQVVIALVIALTGWAWGARVLRAQTLSLRQRDFVQAARASGESLPRIIICEILPNLTAIIATTFINTVNAAVLAEVTLAFIGVTSISDWNWGTILFWAQSNQALFRGAWWWFVPAGLCIAMLGMSLALVNFGIDEFVNPRLRSTGMNARRLRQRGIRPRIGYTPVVRSKEEDAHDIAR
ncbi:ABC transporter permease [Actinomyces urogenitalis]|uniref:ABC transporter permease n=1 Tax=Actinomyces urogenitalis TaxID=103621 RepID=UPI0024329D66|nr:ABC transporter permease [Actinomyces urogenitalis]MCI7456082.1 ABC transporter permease [Actinomyces urogenitalis]